MSVKNRRWLDTHDDMLIAEIKAGASYSEAAAKVNKEFKTSFSRNAAVGRGKRLGLCIGEAKRLEKLRTCMAAARAAPRKPGLKPRSLPPQRIVCQPVCPGAIPPRHIPFDQLSAMTCRWPYGEGHASTFTYCGHVPSADSPYCLAHTIAAVGPGTETERRAHRGHGA